MRCEQRRHAGLLVSLLPPGMRHAEGSTATVWSTLAAGLQPNGQQYGELLHSGGHAVLSGSKYNEGVRIRLLQRVVARIPKSDTREVVFPVAQVRLSDPQPTGSSL